MAIFGSKAAGGKDTLENLTTMCWPCNDRKADTHTE